MDWSKRALKMALAIFIVAIMSLSNTAFAAETIVEIIDPTPDLKAPVLNGFNISSNQATPTSLVKVSADVTDDLSGVSRVYVTYKKPSGKTSGANLTLNTATQKYEGTIPVTSYDEAGEWVPYYLTLTDKKENTGNVYDISSTYTGQKFDLKPYSFSVSGVTTAPPPVVSTDTTAPILNEIAVDKNQLVGAGTVKVIGDITDTETGVSSACVYYLKPSGKMHTVYLYLNTASGKYDGSINIDKYEEIGDWKLAYVRMYDKAGNSSAVYDATLYANSAVKKDFSNCELNVSGIVTDSMAPFLTSLAIEKIQCANNTAIVKLFAEFYDELSGVNSVTGAYTKPSGKTMNITFTPSATEVGKYGVSIPVDKYDELETYKLKYLTLTDRKGNSKSIYDTTPSKLFKPFEFTVRGAITIPPVSPFSIEVIPKMVKLNPGESAKLAVIQHNTDGSTEDITLGSKGTTYVSSNPAAVSVSSDGMVTIAKDALPATVFLDATKGGLTGTCRVVIPGVAQETDVLQVSPMSMSLAYGEANQLRVVLTSQEGIQKDVTDGSSGIIYTSSDTSLAIVDSNGLIRVANTTTKGTVKISINYKGITGESVVNVTGPPKVSGISMTPDIATIKYGDKVQMSVWGLFTDNSTKDVTSSTDGTVYTVSDTTKASVEANGLVTISSKATSGTITVKATNNGFSALSTININGIPIPTDITFDEVNGSMYPGTTHRLSLKSNFSDGSLRDITSSTAGTTYRTSNAYATVDAEGLVTIAPTAKVGGTVIVYATNGDFTTSKALSVIEDLTFKLTEIKLTNDSLAYNPGESYQFKVTGVYGDGTTKDITASSEGTTYRASNSFATVDAEGVVTITSTARSGGSVVIYAYNGNLTTSTTLTITEDLVAKITTLSLENDATTYYPGKEYQFKSEGVFSDSSTRNVTLASEGTKYRASNAYATVSADGLVTIASTAKIGGSVIIYSYNGTLTASKNLTITGDTSNEVTSINLESSSSNFLPGSSYQLTTSEIYGNGTIKDITSSAAGTTYRASNANATVDTEGRVTIGSSVRIGGVVTIYAYSGTFVASKTITITEAAGSTLSSIKLESDATVFNPGKEYQMRVMGQYADGSTKDMGVGTEGTTYRSSNAYATVDANGKVTLTSTAKDGGTVTIFAYNGGLSTSKVITISEDSSTKITALSLTSSTTVFNPGNAYQFTLTGICGDGSTKDITPATEGTTYRASNAYATVDADGRVTISPAARIGKSVIIYAYNRNKAASYTILIK